MNKRFLIVKTSAVGDVITALDVASYLRARFPNAKIDWVVEKSSSSLLKAHPHLDRIIVCDTKKWRKGLFRQENRAEMKQFKKELRKERYDTLFDLQGNSKSALFTFLAKGKDKVGFCFKTAAEKPNALVTNRRFSIPKRGAVRMRYLELVQGYFKDDSLFTMPPLEFALTGDENERLQHLLEEPKQQDKMKIMVAFSSNWKNKQLPKEYLNLFLKEIDRKLSPYFFFPYGSNKEKACASELQAFFPKTSLSVGEMTLPFWQRLIGEMEALITMDSAALHLSGTTTTPSFSLFGPSLSSVYKPYASHHIAVQGRCPYEEEFAMRCPKLRSCPTGACMQAHGTRQLATTFSHFWQEFVIES